MMETYIALLRGINVSGQKMIKMEELKKVLGESGFTGIRTYIQSGNIIFGSMEKNAEKLATEIAATILSHWRFAVPVVIRTMDELSAISQNNPLLKKLNGISDKLHVTFLSAFPDKDTCSKLLEYQFLPDEFELVGKEVYLYCPNGYGQTKLTNQFFESKLKVNATTRNWKTVEALLGMNQS